MALPEVQVHGKWEVVMVAMIWMVERCCWIGSWYRMFRYCLRATMGEAMVRFQPSC